MGPVPFLTLPPLANRALPKDGGATIPERGAGEKLCLGWRFGMMKQI